MNEIDRAWLAGFFEGDGTIRNDSGVKFKYIVISQKDVTILKYIQKVYQLGDLKSFRGYQGNTYWRLWMRGSSVRKFYELVRPYMQGYKAHQLDRLSFSLFPDADIYRSPDSA